MGLPWAARLLPGGLILEAARSPETVDGATFGGGGKAAVEVLDALPSTDIRP